MVTVYLLQGKSFIVLCEKQQVYNVIYCIKCAVQLQVLVCFILKELWTRIELWGCWDKCQGA